MQCISKKQITTWATAAYIILLTTLCLVRISAPTPDLKIIGFDKLVHFGCYFVLNVLLVATAMEHRNKSINRDKAPIIQLLGTTIAAVIYGVVIEFIQDLVGRSFDFFDIVANSLGAITAAIMIRFFTPTK